jgi:hypothetical protein
MGLRTRLGMRVGLVLGLVLVLVVYMSSIGEWDRSRLMSECIDIILSTDVAVIVIMSFHVVWRVSSLSGRGAARNAYVSRNEFLGWVKSG